jgi:hypothetical protein
MAITGLVIVLLGNYPRSRCGAGPALTPAREVGRLEIRAPTAIFPWLRGGHDHDRAKTVAGKPDDASVIQPEVRVQDVIDQLEADDVGALGVSDDGTTIGGIISAADIGGGLKTVGRDVVDLPIGDLMTRDVISCDIGEPMSRNLRARGPAPDPPCADHPKPGALRHDHHAGRGQIPPRRDQRGG